MPNKDDAFKTHPINVLNEKTLKGTFFGNYKPRSDLPSVVEMYMNKVSWLQVTSSMRRILLDLELVTRFYFIRIHTLVEIGDSKGHEIWFICGRKPS